MTNRPRFAPIEVRSYYDRHTKAFVTYGQGGNSGAIHRAVWGAGVTTRDDAFHFVEDQIARLVPAHAGGVSTAGPAHIVDLGCGVAGSLCYLAKQLPVRGTGVTLSPVQADHATARIDAAGLSDRVRCIEGDFCHPPTTIPTADVVFAIESFVHGPDPARFFSACGNLLRPGGVLAICDDFARPTSDPAAPACIERYRRGWHINSLLSREQLRKVAGAAGFVHEQTADLSPHLELDRPRDRLIAGLVWLVHRIPPLARRYDDLVGGNALQTCLKRGWVGYDLAVFRHSSEIKRTESVPYNHDS